ncbi:MAG: sigma-70 family RNA polymerase sigma factor [Acidobacteriota bacterium]
MNEMEANSPPAAWRAVEGVLLDPAERRKLVSYARSRFGIAAEDAEDLLQETALESLRQRCYVESPPGFVFAMFRARCCRFLDAGRRQGEVFATGPGRFDEVPIPEDPNRLDRQLALREALTEISSSCRRLLAAYYVEGRTLRDASHSVALAASGVSKTLNRCLKRLRRCLN